MTTSACDAIMCVYPKTSVCCNRQITANRADPDQTAPTGAVLSVSTLFAIPLVYFGRIPTLSANTVPF